MKSFINDDFMLNNDSSKLLYHEYAKETPIFDYHCHLEAENIYLNEPFDNLTSIWINGDHYKWRAMRINGMEENYITGNAAPYEKFLAWAETVPNTLGSPLYHWTHLELKRYFNLDCLLSRDSAKEVWDWTKTQLKEKDFLPRNLLIKDNVKHVYTTDDPIDSLEYHELLAQDSTFNISIKPTFRADKSIDITSQEFNKYIYQLEKVTSIKIIEYEDFLNALKNRIDYFTELGCAISDHSFEFLSYNDLSTQEIHNIFKKKKENQIINQVEAEKFKFHTLIELMKMYYEKNWTVQLHIGALRNNNTYMYNNLGENIGCDSIGDENYVKSINKLLDSLEKNQQLPKVILYNLNPMYNEALGSIMGNFTENKIKGKVQLGPAWWFNDQQDGIISHLKTYSNFGLLSHFIGMVTDSRSLLSYSRHEYFRRILCNYLGELIEKGELPKDYSLIGNLVKRISYYNAKEFFYE